MNNFLKYLICCLFVLLSLKGSTQQIIIDGEFDDWENIDPVYVDQTGDGQSNGVDFTRVWMHSDAFFLYFSFETNKEIDLQDNSDLAIYLDFDNNINTGFKINGVGAEIRYFFGERFGIINEGNNSEFVNYFPLNLIAGPTVTGSRFEFTISRSISESGVNIVASPTIAFRIEDNEFGGDEAPDELEGIEASLLNAQPTIPTTDLAKSSGTDFRLMTYNIEVDQLFDPGRKENFRRIFQATSPDIIALQEVRDYNSLETKNLIQEFLPGNVWFHKKHGFDIILVSKYPITFSESIDGNAAFTLDVNGQYVVVINCHLYCCDDDTGRQAEVDNIMAYIRELKAGNSSNPAADGTPIMIVGDMNFVGDMRQPHTLETGDIFANGIYGPDFSPDWDETTLKEAGALASNSFSNFTWLSPNSSYIPGKLDYVYYTDSKLKTLNAYALYTPILSNEQLEAFDLEPLDVIEASDHMPVLVDFAYGTVSTNDFISEAVQIYPNPAHNQLSIESEDNFYTASLILDITGRVVQRNSLKNSPTNKINIKKLAPGFYYLMLHSSRGKVVTSFIKK